MHPPVQDKSARVLSAMGDELPTDPISRAALLLRIIDDIDGQDEEQRNALLSAFLSAAFGKSCAFEQ